MTIEEKVASQKITDFFRQYSLINYPDGKDILLGSDQPESVYYLETGQVREYDISEKTGQDVVVHIFEPGAFFPFHAAISNQPCRFFYATLGPTQIRIAPVAALRRFLLANPDALLFFTTRLARGLEGISQRIKLLILGEARQQVLSELFYLARHFGQREGNRAVILRQFTHQQIGSLTGLARETVSHILESATREGLLEYEDRHIVIADVAKLLQETLL